MSYFDQCKIKLLNIDGGDIPDSQYFALKGYTSVSKLKLLDPRHGGSPDRYLMGFDYGYNESLLLGTCVHTQILQPDDFSLSEYTGKPAGKLGFFVEKVRENRMKGMKLRDAIDQASIDADYYAGKLSDKLLKKAVSKGFDYYVRMVRGEFKDGDKETLVLSPRLLDSAHACIKSINNNWAINSILSNKLNLFRPKQFYNEIALFSDILVTLPDGTEVLIKFKGKLDSVVWDPEKKILYLNDVKTTSKNIDYFMDHVIDGVAYDGVFSHHSYYMQLGAYSVVLQKYFQEKLNINDYTLQSNIFAVETTGEYRSEVFRINNSYIDLGIQEFKQLLVRLAWHQTYGFDKQFPE